ncbi:MAG: hypothetical protein ACM3PZ_00455 [Bacillota bacterium]
MRIVRKKAISAFILGVLSLFMSGFFLPAEPVLADQSLISSQEGFGSGEIGVAFDQEGKPDDIRIVVIRIIKVALTILGLLLVAILVLAGYRYMTANGNEDQTKKAIKEITEAVIGLLVVLVAWGVTAFVMRQLLSATGSQILVP